MEMSTMERLFLEIFDRKSRIEGQLHQQFDSYIESLALNVIADGGRPPPWLWEIGRSTASCPDPGGLNKEQLISGLIFPVPLVKSSLDLGASSWKQNHNKIVEAKVVEDSLEVDELNWVSNSRSSLRDFEYDLRKKAMTANLQKEGGTCNKKTGRKTMLRAASKRADCEKDSFVANSFADMQNGYGGRVTRSKSRLLAKEFNSFGKLTGVESFSTECPSEMPKLQFVELNNFSSDNRDNVDGTQMHDVGTAAESNSGKMQFEKSSTLLDNISLIEHIEFNEIHDCHETESSFSEFPNEKQFHSDEDLVSIPEAMQPEPEKSTRLQTMGMHVSPNLQIQQRHMLYDTEDISGVEADRTIGGIKEDNVEFLVVENLECAPHRACELPGLPSTSPAFSPTRKDTLKSFECILDNGLVSTVIARESSSANSLSHSREEQMCRKLKKSSEGDATLLKDEANTMLDGTDIQFHNLKEIVCRKKSVSGSDVVNQCACSYVVFGKADNFQTCSEGSLCNAHVSLLEIEPLEGDNLATVACLIGKAVDSVPVEYQGQRQEVSEAADSAQNFVLASNLYKSSDTHMVSSLELDSGSSKRDSSLQCADCSVCSCPVKRKISENILEWEKKRYRHSVHACQSCLTTSFPVQDRGLRKVKSETYPTEAVSKSINFSGKALDPTRTNDVSTPDEHSVGIIDDEVAGSNEMNISMLPFSMKEGISLSAEKTDSETNFLEVEDYIDRKAYADKETIGPDAAEKSVSGKALASGYEESKTVPSECHNLQSSTVGTYGVIESKRPIKFSDCEYENSWPKRKKIKYKSSNIIATSPRSRARSFLDINQQSECKHKIVSVSESTVIQSPPKLSIAVQNNTSHILEDDSDFNSNIHDLVISPNGDRQIKVLQVIEENSIVCSRDEVRPTKLMPSEPAIHHTYPDTEFIFSYVDALENKASESLGYHNKSEKLDDAPQCLYRCDISTTSDTAVVKSNCDETMPEFEGFNIDFPYTVDDNIVYKDADIPSIAKERAFVIEQLRLSSIFPTPSKPSIMNKKDIISVGFRSSPLGILENMNLGFSLEHNNPDIEHFTTSSSIKLMDICCNIGSQLDGSTLDRSRSLSSSTAWFSSELKNPPLTPPVRKFSYGRLSGKINSSSVTVSSIPELTCFRIDENSSTTEENADFAQVGHSTYRTSVRNIEISSNSKPLSDVTVLRQNDTGFLSNFKDFVVRDSLESVKSDASSSVEFDYVGRESKIENKENFRHTNVIRKPQRAARTMNKLSEKSKLSCNSSESIGNYQNIRKGCKPSNILSNISSFVPQILQKQQKAPPLQGVKDIKVKALEIAEAAKRIENQKQIEREKRKAAAKFEREKLKQENAKLLKLKQKQKEEERRKKEEDVAARKRQREEEERKIKERKRRRIEEAITLQREYTEKLYYEKDEKDIRQKVVDEKQKKRKQKAGRVQNKLERLEGANRSQVATEGQYHTMHCASGSTKLGDDKIQASDEHNSFEKGVGCSNVFREANKETISSTPSSLDLLSYEMSPYQNSDDEDIEDSWRKKKYVPLWARKENLSEIILSNQHLDPKEIFSRKRSFNISQVLSTHALRRRPLT